MWKPFRNFWSMAVILTGLNFRRSWQLLPYGVIKSVEKMKHCWKAFRGIGFALNLTKMYGCCLGRNSCFFRPLARVQTRDRLAEKPWQGPRNFMGSNPGSKTVIYKHVMYENTSSYTRHHLRTRIYNKKSLALLMEFFFFIWHIAVAGYPQT